LLTYPRSDCSFLPNGHHGESKSVIAALTKHAPSLASAALGADISLRSKAWNDKKVTAHHAIVPTPDAGATPNLKPNERAVYELVAQRYLTQFLPPFVYVQTKLELVVEGESFVGSGREIISRGWRSVVGASEDGDSSAEAMPPLEVGDAVTVADASVSERKTQPPKAFTDATLIQAMCNVARFVSDANVKKILSDADGIGTPATRAAIIETLFARGYIVRQKKVIVSTTTGRALIESLPSVATTPDMTAVWEAAMRAIQDGSQTLDAFLARVSEQLSSLVDAGKKSGRIAMRAR